MVSMFFSFTITFWPSHKFPASVAPFLGHLGPYIRSSIQAILPPTPQFLHPRSYSRHHQSPEWQIFLAIWDLSHASGDKPLKSPIQWHIGLGLVQNIRREGVGPESGRVGKYDRMGSAHTPICFQIALSCVFLQGSVFLSGAGKYLDIVHRRMNILLIWLHYCH